MSATPAASFHSHVTYNPVNERFHHRIKEILWKTAAIATVVAFTALALVSTIFAAMEDPMSLPVLLTAFLTFGLHLSYQAVSYCWKNAEAHTNEVQWNQRIITKMQGLPTDFRELARQYGVDKIDLADNELSKLAPLIARTQILIESADKELQEVDDALQKLHSQPVMLPNRKTAVQFKESIRMNVIDFTQPESEANRRDLIACEINLNNRRQQALIERVQAAYCLCILQNPRTTAAQSHYCTQLSHNYQMRLFSKALSSNGDDSWELFMKRHSDGKTYTVSDIAQMNLKQIAQEFFAVNQASA